MPQKRSMHQKEIGQLRIFLTSREKHPDRAGGWQRFLPSKALYMEIIHAAKATEGIVTATAHATHYGYCGAHAVQGGHAEDLNPHLPLCVELVGDREVLQNFCVAHERLLSGKVILYKHLEHWSFDPHGLKVKPAGKRDLLSRED